MKSLCWILVAVTVGAYSQTDSGQLNNCTKLAHFTSHLALLVYCICIFVMSVMFLLYKVT